jgi:hypothetical protein
MLIIKYKMVEEEDQKLKIFNTIHMNHSNDTPKKKYFRIEKDKSYSINDTHSKLIFRTKKDNNFLRRKTLREIVIPKPNKIINNKFITTTIDDTTVSAQSENSFFVKNIIPRKLTIIQENQNTKKNNENIQENDKNKIHRKNGLENFEKCKIKLMFVHFNSIKNLCKYINQNFFDFGEKENIMVDTFLFQVYQTFRILNRKINEFNKFYKDIYEKLKSEKKEEDFKDILTLKQNLQFMKNILSKTMSENLVNILINVDNFCKIFSSCDINKNDINDIYL